VGLDGIVLVLDMEAQAQARGKKAGDGGFDDNFAHLVDLEAHTEQKVPLDDKPVHQESPDTKLAVDDTSTLAVAGDLEVLDCIEETLILGCCCYMVASRPRA